MDGQRGQHAGSAGRGRRGRPMRRCLGGQPYDGRGLLGGQPDHQQRRELLLAPSWRLPVRPNKQWQHAPVPVRRITFVLPTTLRSAAPAPLPPPPSPPLPSRATHPTAAPAGASIARMGPGRRRCSSRGTRPWRSRAPGGSGRQGLSLLLRVHKPLCTSMQIRCSSPQPVAHMAVQSAWCQRSSAAWREVIGRTGWSLSPGRSTLGPPGLCASDSSRKISDLRLSVPRSFRVPACAMEPTRM